MTRGIEDLEAKTDRLLDVTELAAFLHVSTRFVYGRTSPSCPQPIPHLKLGKFVRFRLSEVLKWLEDNSR
jgi:predicted DNA-binding transcriptional regulator AlpA